MPRRGSGFVSVGDILPDDPPGSVVASVVLGAAGGPTPHGLSRGLADLQICAPRVSHSQRCSLNPLTFRCLSGRRGYLERSAFSLPRRRQRPLRVATQRFCCEQLKVESCFLAPAVDPLPGFLLRSPLHPLCAWPVYTTALFIQCFFFSYFQCWAASYPLFSTLNQADHLGCCGQQPFRHRMPFLPGAACAASANRLPPHVWFVLRVSTSSGSLVWKM